MTILFRYYLANNFEGIKSYLADIICDSHSSSATTNNNITSEIFLAKKIQENNFYVEAFSSKSNLILKDN